MAVDAIEQIDAGKSSVTFETKDFTVGGKGMVAFYDGMIPTAARKIGKKHGAKVESIEMETGTQQSLPITESLSETVDTVGLPKFAPAPAAEETPEERAARERREELAEVRARDEEAVAAGAPITTRGRQQAAARITGRRVKEARKEGRKAGRLAGFKAAQKIGQANLKRLKDKTATVDRIKSDLVKQFKKIFKGRSMQEAGLRDIQSLLNTIKNAKTEAGLERALAQLEKLSAKLTFKEAKAKARRAIKRRKRSRDVPIEFREPLAEAIEELEKLIAGKPSTTEEFAQQALEIEEATDALLFTLTDALAEKNEIVLQRKTTEGEAILAILAEVEAGRDPMKGLTSRDPKAKASLRSRAWTWHMDMNSMVQRITGDLGGNTNFYSLMVENFRRAEERYNEQLRDVRNKLDDMAKRAGFRNLEDASNQISGTHGTALVEMVEVTLGGTTHEITLGEAMHLILMDPMTRADIQAGAPLRIQRGEGTPDDIEGVTVEELDAIRDQLDPKHVEFADELKELIETDIKPGMFAAVRRIKGAEPEEVADYWPRSRARDSKTELSVDDFLSGAMGAGQIMSMFLENSGMTQRRAAADTSTPILLTSALTTFVDHADTGLRIANMAEPIRLADKALRNDDVQRSIKKRWGVDAYKMLREYVLSSSGMREGFHGGVDRLVSVASSNVATSYLSMNPRTWLVQLTAIPRFLTHFNPADIITGVAWALKNIGSIREILSAESGYFWRRWSRSSAERFGPQKYGQLVPIDREGMVQSLVNVGINLSKMKFKDAYKSWSSFVDGIMILDWFDALVAGSAYGAARAKLSREGVSGGNLTTRAAQLASDAMRDTQNSTSTLDLTMGALAGRQSSMARPFLMFSSDPLKTTNILVQAGRYIKAGEVQKGAGMISGVIISSFLATALRVGYFGGLAAAMAAIGGDDDDQKKAKRAEESNERWLRGSLREVFGLTFFAPVLEMAYSGMFGEGFLRGNAMENPITGLIKQTAAAGDQLTTAIANLSDEEQEQVMEKLLFASIRASNEFASLAVGNPLRPWVNDARKLGEATLTDPVRALRGLERFYKEIPAKDLTPEQRAYFVRSMGYMKSVRKLDTMISERKKVLERLVTAGQEDRAMKVREALQTLRDKRREIAQEALGEIRPSGESD